MVEIIRYNKYTELRYYLLIYKNRMIFYEQKNKRLYKIIKILWRYCIYKINITRKNDNNKLENYTIKIKMNN